VRAATKIIKRKKSEQNSSHSRLKSPEYMSKLQWINKRGYWCNSSACPSLYIEV